MALKSSSLLAMCLCLLAVTLGCSGESAPATAIGKTAQAFYLPSGGIVAGGNDPNLNQLCFHVVNDNLSVGAGIDLYPCDRRGSETFTVESWDNHGTFEPSFIAPVDVPSLCLGLKNGDYNAGVLELESCDFTGSTLTQQWYFSSGELRSGGLIQNCLDVQNAQFQQGTTVHMTNCNATEAQVWWPYDDAFPYSLFAAPLNVCAGPQNGTLAAGVQMVITQCQNNDQSPYAIFNRMDGLVGIGGYCLSAPSVANHFGWVSIQSCNPQDPTQWWSYKAGGWGGVSQIVNDASGSCLDINGGSSVPGTPLDVWTCNQTKAQSWIIPSWWNL